jgi:hypothetical protein
MASTERVMRRDEWLAQTKTRTRPWEAEGVSERTWYRRRQVAEVPVAEVAEVPVALEVPVAEVLEVPVAQVSEPQLPLIASSYGPGRCAQCNGLRDGQEREVVIGQKRVLLHDVCERFWRNEDTRHPRVGGGWG